MASSRPGSRWADLTRYSSGLAYPARRARMEREVAGVRIANRSSGRALSYGE